MPARRSDMSPDQRVVVTGLGVVCGWGEGIDALWQGLLGAGTAIRPFRRFDAARYRTQLAAEVPGDLGDGSIPWKSNGHGPRARLSLADRFALAAAGEALAQAGLEPKRDTGAAGVFFGSSTGGMWESENYYAHLIGQRPGRAQLSWITSQQYNGPGDAVAPRPATATQLHAIPTSVALALVKIGTTHSSNVTISSASPPM